MAYYDRETPEPDLTECFAKPGGQELLADVFLPDKAKHTGAAVVFVHGGGWNAGERQAFLWHAHRLSLRGYVCCTIDYRLTDTAPFPAAVEDCQAAVRWLRKNAERLSISPDRIGAVGSSAGGHLVACLGALDDEREEISAKVNCVVDVHGVHDFLSLAENAGQVKPGWEAFIGGTITERRDLWVQASPALHVDANSAPMLVVHDPDDSTVPYDQSLLLANALMAASRPLRFLPSPGSGHGFVYNPGNTWTQNVWPLAVAWLDDHLLDAPSAELLEEEM